MDCEERTDLFLATSPPENRQQESLHNEGNALILL